MVKPGLKKPFFGNLQPKFLTMIVTIPSTKEHAGQGLRTFKVSDQCPVCGGPRGPVFGVHSYDGSRRLNCDGWENPCGHLDTYTLIRETGEPAPYKEPCCFGKYENGLDYGEFLFAYEGERKTVFQSNNCALFGAGILPLKALYNSLKNQILEERFFACFTFQNEITREKEQRAACPITRDLNGFYQFFGNFEALSHVFLFYTNDPEIIEPVCQAIRSNEGWKRYYEKNLPLGAEPVGYAVSQGPFFEIKTPQEV